MSHIRVSRGVASYRGFTIGWRNDVVVTLMPDEDGRGARWMPTCTSLNAARYAIDRLLDGPEAAPLCVPVLP